VNWTHVFDLENIFSFTTDSNNKESGIWECKRKYKSKSIWK
jgi:hypothetical protein